MEDAGAFGELVAPVPGPDDVLHAGVESGFGEADEKADAVHLFGCVAAGEGEGQDRPDHLHGGDPDAGPDAGQDEVGRDLADDIAHCPKGLHVVQLVLVQAEVLFHSADEGVGDVGLVEILDEVAQGGEGQEGGVEFEEEAAFLGTLVERVPDVGPPVSGRCSVLFDGDTVDLCLR